MEIAIVGANAQTLCRRFFPGARGYAVLPEAGGCDWELLALTRDAACGAAVCPFRAHTLLLPGDSDPALAAHAMQIVGYGFSPRDTLTLSSVTGAERLLCLQRSLLTADSVLLEPQELPLPPELCSLPEEDALLLAGVRLLCSGIRA